MISCSLLACNCDLTRTISFRPIKTSGPQKFHISDDRSDVVEQEAIVPHIRALTKRRLPRLIGEGAVGGKAYRRISARCLHPVLSCLTSASQTTGRVHCAANFVKMQRCKHICILQKLSSPRYPSFAAFLVAICRMQLSVHFSQERKYLTF